MAFGVSLKTLASGIASTVSTVAGRPSGSAAVSQPGALAPTPTSKPFPWVPVALIGGGAVALWFLFLRKGRR